MVPGPRPLHPSVKTGHSGKGGAPLRTLEVLPELDRARIAVPELPADRLWDPRTSNWWVDIWQSPMRLEWDASDGHALLLAAYLIDEFWKVAGADDVDHTSLTKLSKAILDRLVRLGGDPFARRSLQWVMAQTDESEERVAASKARRAKPVGKRRGLEALG